VIYECYASAFANIYHAASNAFLSAGSLNCFQYLEMMIVVEDYSKWTEMLCSLVLLKAE
jgi:hypothetical protein